MSAPSNPEHTPKGNFVSEWFGHRVFPTVAPGENALTDQRWGRCPFLSLAAAQPVPCVKPASSKGICTISTPGPIGRQDWLVCPHRALDPGLLESAARRLFSLPPDSELVIEPAPKLQIPEVRSGLVQRFEAGARVITYLQDKLGGEISVSPTDRSPEFSFDITFVELGLANGDCVVGKYGILEVQTMDFHGSYRAVVNNLQDALRLHGEGFPQALGLNPQWLSERIEGPNIANVFKRTFYQIAVKFQIGSDESCAGCVLAIPSSVWNSWQRHLGKPELVALDDGTFLLPGEEGRAEAGVPAWIYVFNIDSSPVNTPAAISASTIIGTDAEAITYYALKVAPEIAVSGAGKSDRVLGSIRQRLRQWWPAEVT